MPASRDAAGPTASDTDTRQAASGVMASATASTSPAGASTSAGRTEHQRRRHRANMSRYRHKKKNVLEDMRVSEQVLAAQVQSMLQLHAAQSPTYSNEGSESKDQHQHVAAWRLECADPRGLSVSRRPLPTPMDEYVRALTQRERLESENAALRQQVRVFQTLEEAVQEATSAQVLATDSWDAARDGVRAARNAASGASGGSSEDDSEPGHWVQFVENESPFYYVPLSPAQYRSMVAETMQQVFAFQLLNVCDKHPATARVLRYFDWTASLTIEWDEDSQTRMMRYQFCKTFRNPARSVDETAEAHWGVMHDPVLHQKIHSMPVKMRILQRGDENTTVVMVNAPTATQSLKYRSVSLLSRSEYMNPEGKVGKLVVMAKQRLDLPTKVTSRGEEVVYTSGGFLHVIYMPGENLDGRREMDVEYGGRIPLPSEAQARFLMVDIGNALIRLESLLFPLRVLCSSE